MATVTNDRRLSIKDKDAKLKSIDLDGDDIEALDAKDPYTGNASMIDNSNPSPFLKYLLPVALSPISVKKIPRVTSTDLLITADKLGFSVTHHSLGIYEASRIGHPRLCSNSDLVSGYGNIYGPQHDPLVNRLNNMMDTRSDIHMFLKALLASARGISDPFYNDEEDDALRTTNQRTKYYGRHLSLPASDSLIGVKYDKRFLEIIRIVCKHYIDATEAYMPSRFDAMASITDATDTALGAPSFASAGKDEYGYTCNEKRIISCADWPIPNYKSTPFNYLSDIYAWGGSLGLPDDKMTLASPISYRQGAKGHKGQLLWYNSNNSFVADYEGMSMESNMRVVYPAPFVFNVILSPMVFQMKYFRKLKLGMFHTPAAVSKYIPKLNKQGSVSYESDFSKYDTTVSNKLMVYACRCLAEFSRKYSWEYELFAEFLQTTGVISPSFLTAEPNAVTFLSGAVSLLSGILPTSEIGSLISVSANLFALEGQLPNIVSSWLNNNFVILVQSDDVLFTLPSKLNEKLFSERMALTGLSAKLKEGYMFLKKLLPVGALAKFQGKFPLAGVPLVSRQPQQTFFNENNYSDGQPDAILRLALLSRSEGLHLNPAMTKSLNDMWIDLLNKHPLFRPVLNNLYDGVLSLNQEDKDAVIAYSTSDKGMAWISKIINRMDSDPKAKLMIEELIKLGFDFTQYEDTAVSQRKAFMTALFTAPSSSSREKMIQICRWLNN